MQKKVLKTIVYSLIFGSLSGVALAVLLSVLIPQFYTDWAGSLVCAGKIEYFSFKQSYFCRNSANEFFDAKNLMFWAVFWRILLPALLLGFLSTLGFIKLVEFLWKRRAAAGF